MFADLRTECRGVRMLLVAAAAVITGGLEGADDPIGESQEQVQLKEIVRFAPGNVQIINAGGRAIDHDLGLLFDQLVFRRSRGSRVTVRNDQIVVRQAASHPAESALEKLGDLRDRGDRRIARLDQACGLTAEQRQTLDLALTSDLHRLASEIDAARRPYAGQRLAGMRHQIDQATLQAVQRDAARCRGLVEQAFGEGSLMMAVAIGVLGPAQGERLAAWVAERRATRWEAMVRLVLGQLETSLGLSSRQQAALVEHLLADVPPLAVFEERPVGAKGESFQNVLVLARLGRIGEPVLRPLLDPRQWAELAARIDQAGPPADVERMLVAQGILEKVNPAVGAGGKPAAGPAIAGDSIVVEESR